MNLLSQLFSDRLIFALGWTILHSLWQGALVALGFALLLIFLRRHNARTRYFWGLACLALILAISLITFFTTYQANPVSTNSILASSPAAVSSAGILEADGSRFSNVSGFMLWFRTYFTRHLPLVVTVWLMGILILILRLSGGVIYNQRLKIYGTSAASKVWQDRLGVMCRNLRFYRPVTILQSSLVKIPLTTGHFKPVILVPLGMLAGLPHNQVEALIAHELAHILRKDYLLNMIQSLVDILFFFHPGIRWISSIIRSERENCCDDIAVSLSGDSINFARALTSLQAVGFNRPDLAMSARGSKPKLLKRVKRLLYIQPSNSRTCEGFIGGLILTICALTMVIGANSLTSFDGGSLPSTRQDNKKIVKGQEEKKKIEAQIKRIKEKLLRIRGEEALRRKAEKREIENELKKMVEIRHIYENEGKKLTKIQQQRLREIKEIIEVMKRRVSEGELNERARLVEESKRVQLQAAQGQALVERQRLLEIRELIRRREIQKKEQREKQQALMAAQREEMAVNLERMKSQNARVMEQQKILGKVEQERMKQLNLKMKLMEERQRSMVEEMELQKSELRKREAEIENLVQKFLQQLYHDRLMEKGRKKRIHLTTQSLFIGGVKQPDRFLRKYLALYKQLTGSPLLDGKSFIIDP